MYQRRNGRIDWIFEHNLKAPECTGDEAVCGMGYRRVWWRRNWRLYERGRIEESINCLLTKMNNVENKSDKNNDEVETKKKGKERKELDLSFNWRRA